MSSQVQSCMLLIRFQSVLPFDLIIGIILVNLLWILSVVILSLL